MLNLPCQSMYVIKEEQGGEINKDDKQGQDCANEEMWADTGGNTGQVSECQENTGGHTWQKNTGSRTGQDLDETGGAATESSPLKHKLGFSRFAIGFTCPLFSSLS